MSGAFAGGLAAGFSSGIKDVQGLSKLATEQQDRELTEIEESRKAELYAQQQQARSEERSAEADITSALGTARDNLGGPVNEQPTPGKGIGIETPPASTAPEAAPAAGGSTEPGKPMGLGVKPVSDGTGVTTDDKGPTYDVAEGETEKAPTAGGLQNPYERGVGVLSVEQAVKIAKAHPHSKKARAALDNALARDVAAKKWQAERYDKGFENRLKASQTEANYANAEARRVATQQLRLQTPVKAIEANRQVAESQVKLAGSLSSQMEDGFDLLHPNNIGKAGPAVAAGVDAMNSMYAGTTGFTVKSEKLDGIGYRVTTYKGDVPIGTQDLRTVKDLREMIAAGGIAVMPEKWNEYSAKTTTAQMTGMVKDIAANNLRAEDVKAKYNVEMSELELARAKGAAPILEKIRAWQAEEDGSLENDQKIREAITELGERVPSLVWEKRKTEKIDPVTNEKVKGEERVNFMLERHLKTLPNFVISGTDASGNPKNVDLRAAIKVQASDVKGTEAKAREAFGIDKSKPVPDQLIEKYIKANIAKRTSDPRAQRHLFKLFVKTREAAAEAALKGAATPMGIQTAPPPASVTGGAVSIGRQPRPTPTTRELGMPSWLQTNQAPPQRAR